jgi:hypothetical protein
MQAPNFASPGLPAITMQTSPRVRGWLLWDDSFTRIAMLTGDAA